MDKIKLMLGDNIESLKKLESNSVDSVVTDPPYGLSFMNKKWDYDVPSVEFWQEVYRVLKPGGHILAFGGTRTYHRMVVNIEDAGFEIRDQIQWLYASGFPKSHNIGKAVDKLNGVEVPRNIMRVVNSVGIDNYDDSGKGRRYDSVEYESQNEYEGWGTALKPAQEIVALAQKPQDLEGTALNLIYTIKKEICKLYVKIVEQSSELSQAEQKEVLNIARCHVEKNINIQDALKGLMDISQLKLMENMNWNIVLLWHNILADLCQNMNMYTTSTKSNLIIDLRTLKSLEWQNILENIIQVKDNQTDGLNVNASTAVVLFNALNLKLKDIQQHSVKDNVIYKDDKKDCANEPICLARKPLSEKSVAKNVLKWGTGGINIDGCRIESNGEKTGRDIYQTQSWKNSSKSGVGSIDDKWMEGRFPANIILECICDEVIKGEKGDIHTNTMCPCYMLDEQSSKASRFFYQAKVSKKERNLGLDDFENIQTKGSIGLRTIGGTPLYEKGNSEMINKRNTKNTHPTVKPINLMSYLCRLITPENGIVLDPFMGSGSTGISAMLEGFKFIGMEMDEDYMKIAEARIDNYEQYRELLKK